MPGEGPGQMGTGSDGGRARPGLWAGAGTSRLRREAACQVSYAMPIPTPGLQKEFTGKLRQVHPEMQTTAGIHDAKLWKDRGFSPGYSSRSSEITPSTLSQNTFTSNDSIPDFHPTSTSSPRFPQKIHKDKTDVIPGISDHDAVVVNMKTHIKPTKKKPRTSRKTATGTAPLKHGNDLVVDSEEVSTQHPYLGIILSQDLKWKPHIDNITAKANSTLGFLRRNLRGANKEVRERAYTSLVIPKLEYASAVWDPQLGRRYTEGVFSQEQYLNGTACHNI
ncbi:hypothetical protein Bbelb_100580 [Branchiostoma belcheri]|nr:hypothetical protein Bbelb_100580 [Branchiostoma belcheri]